MDIYSISSVNSYVKSIDLQQQWQQKKETGSFSPEKKSVDEWVDSQKKAIAGDPDREKDKTLETIKTKASSGRNLTSAEMRYLQTKDPVAYAKAQAVATERAIYQRQLLTCRTKEDLHRFKMAHVASALSEFRSITHDHSMSLEEKAEAVAHVRNKMSAVNKETFDFVRSGDYASLPSEAERIRAEKQLARAKREEHRCKKAEKKAREEQLRNRKKDKKRKYRLKEKPKYTVQQAANSYEARKVRRANAKAAYYESINAALAAISPSRVLDSRA